mgnify:CR=1 FL=1|tara:strand:+ start:96 stop:401 length:306 start_codon:yes stop_codon:yes gene_type:complete
MIVHDLEDKIMKVWNTSDDLDTVLHFIDDAEVDPIDFKDQLMNLIIGIQGLHERRSKMLFEEFEKVLKSNKESEAQLMDEVAEVEKEMAKIRTDRFRVNNL